MGHSAVSMSSPYGIQSKKLAMWLFIVADASTFGAILFAYGFLRLANPDWTRPFAFSPTIVNGSVMTVVLLTSSLTMVAAVVAAHAGRTPTALRWLGATMLLGIVFAALHLREWFAMIGEGWRLFQNPLGGSPLFGATFFGITGLHLLHVVCGVVVIGVMGPSMTLVPVSVTVTPAMPFSPLSNVPFVLPSMKTCPPVVINGTSANV